MRFAIRTFGCKVNQYESIGIATAMRNAGFTEISDIRTAELVIINSCSVTGASDKKACHEIEQIRRHNPKAVVVLTGCFPQAFPTEAEKAGADIVTGNTGKAKIPMLVADYLENREKRLEIPPLPTVYEGIELERQGEKTRAFIKIEDGCNRFCSYCIIPYARGHVRSRSIDEITAEVKECVSAGQKEIVLVGINLSCYGQDIGRNLADAVEAVCAIDGVERVRLSSLEPELLDEETIKRFASQKKLCPHFHLSLQSGSDDTLKRMNRRYTADEYYGIVKRLRGNFENPAITTDIMVGFAGETDREFEETMAFAEKVGFAKIHAFSYSIREGTAAAKRTDHVAEQIKSQRYKRLSELDEQLHERFLHSQIGTEAEILIEKRKSSDYANGLTPNYTPVRIYGSDAQRQDIVRVKITDVGDGYCIGEEIQSFQ
ncbi:MAG: tRNA (N(6)-L-threonylcarbamoyladenosine(37)-C(2))-methylthiotransferase MtaB [Ruminiclostridium sp.]|nr:tRNA (N(6)-L-threonylcarbamoyladenosine(37)-C(2))-methylthiotransferase MtaB [Ruminiclostridium sp.]